MRMIEDYERSIEQLEQQIQGMTEGRFRLYSVGPQGETDCTQEAIERTRQSIAEFRKAIDFLRAKGYG
jgi:hypothetical protein